MRLGLRGHGVVTGEDVVGDLRLPAHDVLDDGLSVHERVDALAEFLVVPQRGVGASVVVQQVVDAGAEVAVNLEVGIALDGAQ